MDEIDDLGSKIPRKIPVSRNPTMESELAKHHPLSPYFFEIVGQKILFLFFSSSCVIFFWILQFPQLFTVPFGDALKVNGSVSTVSCTFGFIISVCTGCWFFFLLQVNYDIVLWWFTDVYLLIFFILLIAFYIQSNVWYYGSKLYYNVYFVFSFYFCFYFFLRAWIICTLDDLVNLFYSSWTQVVDVLICFSSLFLYAYLTK